jgi:predicted flap endonuclease-1-like 5' DNA nuclease
MANKNKNVIISFFDNKEAAAAAAQSLKTWDKAHDDIKLGGIGILTWENEKIKTRLVGNRATGTGAKLGVILGVAAGVLSGGVTVLGGALVGVAGGALMGTLFHKHLGLKDADKQRLEQHLQSGGAVVVVMADADEVDATKAELAVLGGKVENYVVPEVTVAEIEEASASAGEGVTVASVSEGDDAAVAALAPAAAIAAVTAESESAPAEVQTVIDERVVIAESDVPAVVGLGGKLESVEGIGPERSAALAAIGIKTRQQLLERGATPEGRAEIAEQSLISPKLIDDWTSAVDLTRVKGIGSQYAGLLTASGVGSVADLAQRTPATLHEQLAAVNETSGKVRELPGVSQLENWVEQAKALPAVLKH